MTQHEKLLENITAILAANARGGLYHDIPQLAVQFLEQAKDRLDESASILRQAQSCIMGETPEDCSPGEAEDDTLARIRGFLNG